MECRFSLPVGWRNSFLRVFTLRCKRSRLVNGSSLRNHSAPQANSVIRSTSDQKTWSRSCEAVAKTAELPLSIDDSSSLTVTELLAKARLYIRRHKVRLIVVDYLRLVEAPGRELRERVGFVANAMRQVAKTEKVAVILLSQLRRPPGGLNHRPTMLDLKESGEIENHSHVVLLPYLPAAENGAPDPERQELIIGKNRNGSPGVLPVYFHEQRLQFMERHRD